MSDLEKELSDAWDALVDASKHKARRTAHEERYALAYQALVRTGARRQIKSKYRSRYSPGHAKG